jgi:hypothetical protein
VCLSACIHVLVLVLVLALLRVRASVRQQANALGFEGEGTLASSTVLLEPSVLPVPALPCFAKA